MKHFHEKEYHDRQKGTVLIFLPGLAEINEVEYHLKRRQSEIRYQIEKLHSSLPRDRKTLRRIMGMFKLRELRVSLKTY